MIRAIFSYSVSASAFLAACLLFSGRRFEGGYSDLIFVSAAIFLVGSVVLFPVGLIHATAAAAARKWSNESWLKFVLLGPLLGSALTLLPGVAVLLTGGPLQPKPPLLPLAIAGLIAGIISYTVLLPKEVGSGPN